MSWYNDDSAFYSEDKTKYTRRFWMPNDSERLVTFVDGPSVVFDGVEVKTPFQYQEYQIKHNGNWRNWFTRHPDPSHDILAKHDHRASKVAAFTVIDHQEYTDRKGTLHSNTLSLYVVKRSQPIWKQIEKLLSRHGSLQGKSFSISRYGDKSPGCGTMLEPVDAWPEFDPAVHKPFNYLEVLAPKTADEIEAILNLSGGSTEPAPQSQGGWGSQPQQNQGGWGSANNGSGGGWGGSGSSGDMPF
jgi:hypothetical protein